jgi:glycosyltransferase involved in cell wall biosynthesis
MRVHVISNLFPPDVLGGYELLAADVVAGLQERGHTVTVVTTGTAPPAPGVARVLHLSRPFGSDARRDRMRHLVAAARNRRALGRLLKEEGLPDAALVMSLRRLGVEPLRVYAERGVPCVLTVNDDWPAAFVPKRDGLGAILDAGPWARGTWRGVTVDRAVYLSDAIRRAVLEAGAPLPAGRVEPQGVRPSSFPTRPFRAMAGEPALLFVGRLHPSKAPEVAIDTVAALSARGVRARIAFAGRPVDEAYGRSLRERAERLGVSGSVTWHGQVARERLPELFAASDALLFPSAWEGEAQGLTYMEAMASGLLVVAYPRGGARELLDAHPVAARATENTGEAFASVVTALIGDPDRQRALVEAARTTFREVVCFDRYLDALERELAAAARGSSRARVSHAGVCAVDG